MVKRPGLLLSLAVFISVEVFAQTWLTDPNRLIVFLREGRSTAGFLVETSSDSLMLLTGGGNEWIPYSSLKTAILRGKRRPGEGFGYGILLGSYLSVLLIATEDNNESDMFFKTGWASSGLGIFITALPGMLVGGGIGYLIDPGSHAEDVVFDFTGPERRHDFVERIRKVHSAENQSSIQFSFYGGMISNRSTGDWRTNQQYSQSQSNFNWMRRAQISYTLLPDLNVAIALIWFGEPKEFRSWYSSPSPNVFESGTANQNLDALGYYLATYYRPFRKTLTSKLEILVGGGIGLANLEYRLDYTWYRSSYDPVTFQSTDMTESGTQVISEARITGFLAGEVRYRVYRGLSLALSVDHVLGPARNLAGISQADLAPRTLKFGNTSVGFGIGLHF